MKNEKKVNEVMTTEDNKDEGRSNLFKSVIPNNNILSFDFLRLFMDIIQNKI